MLATDLAAIYAQVGEKDRALELLESSARRADGGERDGTLRVEPEMGCASRLIRASKKRARSPG